MQVEVSAGTEIRVWDGETELLELETAGKVSLRR